MKEGFYEKVITELVQQELDALPNIISIKESFQKEDGAVYMGRFFQSLIQRAFQQINSENNEAAKINLIELSNELIKLLSQYTGQANWMKEKILPQGEILKALFDRQNVLHVNIKEHLQETFPLTGLSESELFTGSKTGLSLESELKKEMLSSDEIHWLVSFVKFEGVRLFEQVFKTLEQQRKSVKIISTVYMGATDLKAIDFLSQFSNIEIKISYNTQHERLHAKSYIFKRNSGYHTGYIGSSNLSRSALTNGLEWNLKVTGQEIPHIIEKCMKTFETYWNDPDFVFYNATEHRDQLKQALQSGQSKPSNDLAIAQYFDFKPFPFQQEILDQLEKCRLLGENRNLIVAATGTGKTVMAAFDFKRFLKRQPHAKLLFVAHREEILRHARYTFQHILRDNNFGDLWFQGQQPSQYHQLFISIQTLNNRFDTLQLPNAYFDYIIIDEVHHSAATSYQKLLNYFQPKLLLGLTATPERLDSEDITAYFGHSISAEIRLPEALNRRLLSPFQYFGLSDNIDLSQVSWRRGRYDTDALEKIYSEDGRRADDILRNCDKYLKDFRDVRALGFCVSQMHTTFMTSQFQSRGINAASLTSTNSHERNQLIQQFRRKEINYLFVVDIFNEGVDIPEIDTLLFLRPTESLTVFLQQLGRGLRLHEDKNYLTILDFVGQSHAEYSFEHKFRAMLGKTHTRIVDEIENDFPHLPLGCSIVLEKVAKEIIVSNLTKQIRGGKTKLIQAIRRFQQDYTLPCTLKNFTECMGIGVKQIYDTDLLWMELLSIAQQQDITQNAFHKLLARCLSTTWLSSESTSYFSFIIQQLETNFSEEIEGNPQQFLLMLFVDINGTAPQVNDLNALTEYFRREFGSLELRKELISYFQLRLTQIDVFEKPISLGFETVLRLHGRYTRHQILVGLKKHELKRLYPSREGVLNIPELNTEALFVTLDKSMGKYNPTTMYDDYFINSELFHWQSQNSTSPDSSKGQSYIQHRAKGKKILLFTRERNEDELGNTMAFIFCGTLEYVEHHGTKPMNITWEINNTPPALLVNEGMKLAVG